LIHPSATKHRTSTLPDLKISEKLWNGKLAKGCNASASVQKYSSPVTASGPSSKNSNSGSNSGNDSDTSTYSSLSSKRPSEQTLNRHELSKDGIADPKNVKKDKRVKSNDKTISVLQAIAAAQIAQVNMLSYLQKACNVINDEFHLLSLRQKMKIKVLFQNESVAEYFILLSADERIVWVEDEVEKLTNLV
jgi:hypothetical protein